MNQLDKNLEELEEAAKTVDRAVNGIDGLQL
jgi:hypothetical protein